MRPISSIVLTNPSLRMTYALAFLSMYAPPVFWLFSCSAVKISEMVTP